MRDKYLRMFKGVCEAANTEPTISVYNGIIYIEYKWASGIVTGGFGLTKDEALSNFENSVCDQYKEWGI